MVWVRSENMNRNILKNKKIMMFLLAGLILLVMWLLLVLFVVSNFTAVQEGEEREDNEESPTQLEIDNDRAYQEELEYVDTEEDIQIQAEGDAYFAEQERSFYEQYPWYNSAPLSTGLFFLFFDPQREFFVVDVYLDPQKHPDEIEGVRDSINEHLVSIGVNPSEFKIEYNFNAGSPLIDPDSLLGEDF